MNSKVAVIILNWNGYALLQQFLPSVVKHSGDAMVYVVDNASTDHSVQLVHEQFPTVRIIQNIRNGGYAGGYNDALKHIEADYFVLLNSDVEVTENWIPPIQKLMDSDPRVAACQPKLLNYYDREKFEYAGASGGHIDRYGYPFCRGRVFDACETDKGQYDDIRSCFWATGACLFVRANTFHQVGQLDEDFFAHMEEIDLCWRMQQFGYKIMVCPQSVVYHVGGGTLSQQNSKKTYLNFRNGLGLLLKNLPIQMLWYKIPLRIFLDQIAACKFLFDGKTDDFKAIGSAHRDFIKNFNKWRKKRYHHQRKNLLPEVYDGSIVWRYFVLKNRKFSNLDKNKFTH
ncbi:MAG: glycosyltransferase family 2 protein [Bacteroidetes bacterium]|nr:glycosyltransferase family 2 protein [Bacteroidota bacterium]